MLRVGAFWGMGLVWGHLGDQAAQGAILKICVYAPRITVLVQLVEEIRRK